MHEGYEDILSRIQEQPLWYDQNGTPRYDKFHPKLCPNIYADHVALVRIACQECGQQFLVEMHAGLFSERSDIHPSKWHYGDPPRHCKGAGDTMNCEDLEVVEFWVRHIRGLREWKRVRKFEGLVDPNLPTAYNKLTPSSGKKSKSRGAKNGRL